MHPRGPYLGFALIHPLMPVLLSRQGNPPLWFPGMNERTNEPCQCWASGKYTTEEEYAATPGIPTRMTLWSVEDKTVNARCRTVSF